MGIEQAYRRIGSQCCPWESGRVEPFMVQIATQPEVRACGVENAASGDLVECDPIVRAVDTPEATLGDGPV